MYQNKTFTAIIPARAGSKRLKNKNIKNMCGKPLIYWPILAAKDAGIFDDIIVLSDSEEIRQFAKVFCNVVEESPEEASSTAYVGDAIINLLSKIPKTDYVQLIEPTAPLIRHSMIKNAAGFCLDKRADFVISMCEAEAPNGMAKPLSGNLCVKDWWPEELFAKRSQDCPTAYRVDGLIYLGKWETWLQRNYWKSNIYAFVTDRNDSVDINNLQDFERAEAILSYRLRKHLW